VGRVLALQRSAGNRATARLLQRFPDAGEIDSFWSQLVREVEAKNLKLGEIDCREAADWLARIGREKAKERGIKPLRSPRQDALFRISKHDERAEPLEAKEAHGRAWRVRDRVVSAFGHDYMKVWTGGAEGSTPTPRFYPLLPGMMIYTAENAGYTSKKLNTYHWYRRHAAVYRGDGWVRENFGDQLRNIMQGHAEEDLDGAWRLPRDPRKRTSEDPKFLTTLAIYDPFYAYRSKDEEAWLRGGARTGRGAAWDAAKQWLSGP
jgi:hypothetical protein